MESKYDGRRPEPPYVTDAERELEDCREAQKMLMDTYEEMFDERDQLRARNAELEAEVERMRKSLKHFADKAFLADTDGDLKTMSNFQSGGLFIADHVAKIAIAALEASDETHTD